MTHVRRAIAVLGPTGAGKSALAVRLARALPASLVLSCDSIQLYKGLDVITNKATPAEQGGVEHWGLSLSAPWAPAWELGRFVNAALARIGALPADAVPVLAGGTHYWLQHLLFPPPELETSRSAERREGWRPRGPPPENGLEGEWKTLLETFWRDPVYPRGRISAEWCKLSLWKLLEMVDAEEARRWHWKDARKVVTALQRWHDSASSSSVPSPAPPLKPRFDHTLLFWVHEPLSALRPRLDARVDGMLARGLLAEVRELRALATARQIAPSGGLFEAIGFKEFTGVDLDDPAQVREALARMKRDTAAYAKAQAKWIRNQLLPAAHAASRAGDVTVLVVPPSGAGAVEAMHAWLRGETVDPAALHPDAEELLRVDGAGVPDHEARRRLHARRLCEICSTADAPVSVRESQWAAHLRSKGHRWAKKYAGLSREEYIETQRAKGRRGST